MSERREWATKRTAHPAVAKAKEIGVRLASRPRSIAMRAQVRKEMEPLYQAYLAMERQP